MKHLFRCQTCNIYTLKEICQKCNCKTEASYPPKYSPEDKYGKYRRAAKEQELVRKGLL